MLKLPSPGDELPPLVSPQPGLSEPAIVAEREEPRPPEGQVRKRRRRLLKDPESGTPDWEKQQNSRSARSEKILMGAMIGGAVLLVAGALIAFLNSKHTDPTPPAILTMGPIVVPPISPTPLDETPDVGAFLREAEPLAKTFLQAKPVAELLAVVRHPKISGPRLQERHPDGMLKPPGMESFAEGGSVVLEKSTAVVKVRTGTFEEREVSFFKSAGGWKVDWESWVGWSDIPWDEFKETPPKPPPRFRVRLQPII
ncbi:MAG: hypothetical protein CFE26_18180, partial [Verrucomicrobiales bacterium VVV1]